MKFDVVLGDPVDTELYLSGAFEPEITATIRTLASGHRSLYDIGCNIGWFTCVLGADQPDATVVSIDANPIMARRCEAHCAKNGVRAQVLNVGVGPVRACLSFATRPDRPSMGSFGSHAHAPGSLVQKVEVVPFSELVAERQLPAPTFMKVDIEGFEPGLFAGISDEHLSGIRSMILEHSPRMMASCGFDASRLWSEPRMSSFEYRGLEPGRHSWRPLSVEQLPVFEGMVIGERH